MSNKKKPTGLNSIEIEYIYVSETDAQNARRKRFDKNALAELAESVKVYGVLQPIIVRPRPAAGGYLYELVAGERRMLAAETAGLEEIPAVVRELSDEQVIEVQLIENLQRADVHPMEEAEGYQQLMKAHGHPVEELHARVGKSRSYVYGRLKLLALCKKAREAFYAGSISASIATYIARIPAEKLQLDALKEVIQGNMTAREASDMIQDELMKRLAEAPFPTDDPKLNGKAGPCTTCPKRTGNQPELFGDVTSADVCTDPVCFKAKVVAYGQRLLNTAKERGQKTFTGNAAKQIAPYGIDSRMDGWKTLDAQYYGGSSNSATYGKKVRQIIGKDVPRALLQDPKTGAVVEVVSEEDVSKAAKARGPGGKKVASPQSQAEKKVKLERKYRRELYARVRPALPVPTPQAIAEVMLDRLWHDSVKVLCAVRGFEPPVEKRSYGGSTKDYNAVGKGIATWSDADAWALINDMIYVSELNPGNYSKDKPEKLLAAAEAAGVDVDAVRKDVTPAKKVGAGARKKAA